MGIRNRRQLTLETISNEFSRVIRDALELPEYPAVQVVMRHDLVSGFRDQEITVRCGTASVEVRILPEDLDRSLDDFCERIVRPSVSAMYARPEAA